MGHKNQFYLLIIISILFLLYICLRPRIRFENWKNYGKKKLCYNCDTIFIDKKTDQYYAVNDLKIPMWKKKHCMYSPLPKPILEDHNLNKFKNNNFQETNPCNKGNCTSLTFDLNKFNQIKDAKNTWIYYYATCKRDYKNLIYPDINDAFDKYQNTGLIRSDKNGRVKFRLRNPQPVIIDNIFYPPNLQFTYLRDNKTWSLKTFTIIFFPQLDYQRFNTLINKNYAVGINALPLDKGTIPNTIRISYDDIDNVNINNILTRLIKKNQYRKFRKLIRDGRLRIESIPLIIYCKNKDSEATTVLFNYLLNNGYYNLLKYPGGLDDWISHNKKNLKSN